MRTAIIIGLMLALALTSIQLTRARHELRKISQIRDLELPPPELVLNKRSHRQ